MKHTPAPWKLIEAVTAAPIVTAETSYMNTPRRIATVTYHSGSEDPEVDANAQLIAAAPELLEALRTIVENWHPHGTYQEEYKQAKAAIEKATS